MKNKDLAIFGPYPPPLGGVSVHIQRIQNLLEDEGIDYIIFDHYSNTGNKIVPTHKNPLRYLKFLFKKNYSVFHFHQMFLLEYPFYYIFSRINKRPLIVTIHGETLLKIRPWKQKLVLFCLKKTRRLKLISVSSNLTHFLNSNNIEAKFLPAYVPPTLPKRKAIIKDQRIHFLYSIWKVEKELAEKIYNIELAFQFLKREKNRFKMVFMVGNKEKSDLPYLNKLIEKYALQNDIMLIFNENLVDYVQNCDFLLRTNTIDGYGVSLQEAMDLNIPVIASNTCERPEGTITFKNNDLEDLSSKIKFVVNVDKNEILKNRKKPDFHFKLIQLYKSLF